MTKSGIKIVLIYLLTLFSCNENDVNKNIIDVNTMAKIIVDLQYNEGQVNKLGFPNVDSSQVAFSYLQKKTFKKYKVDSLQFVKSYDFYAKNKDLMIDIYSEAENILTLKKENNSKKPAPNFGGAAKNQPTDSSAPKGISNSILDKIKMSKDTSVINRRSPNTRPTR